MEITQESSLEYALKVKIAELYLYQNIKHARVMTAPPCDLRGCIEDFDLNITELIQIASMNEKFEEDIKFNFIKYKRIGVRYKYKPKSMKRVVNEFWSYLSNALRDNNLLVIKD